MNDKFTWLAKKNNSTFTLDSRILPRIYTSSSYLRVKMRQEKAKDEMKKLMNIFYPEIELPDDISAAHYLVSPIHKSSLAIKTFTMAKGKTSAHTVLMPINEKAINGSKKAMKSKDSKTNTINHVFQETIRSDDQNTKKIKFKNQESKKTFPITKFKIETKYENSINSLKSINPLESKGEERKGKIQLKDQKDNKYIENQKKKKKMNLSKEPNSYFSNSIVNSNLNEEFPHLVRGYSRNLASINHLQNQNSLQASLIQIKGCLK